MTVIDVENIGKEYILDHQQSKDDTIRDLLGTQVKRLLGREKVEKDAFWALKNISFQVSQGDVLGIVGSNGAGKSTLLKVLSRIVKPSTGSIRVKGRVASLLEVGTGFHPELTGRENIYLNGAILGMKKQEIKASFDEIVAFGGIERFLDTPVKRYSSGMYVRLGFAVAAHLQPEILIVDEVLAVGDAEFQKKCLGKMKDVSNSGRTILFVSHNLTAVQGLCNRAIYLEKGQLLQDGSTHEVVTTYLHKVVHAQMEQQWSTPSTAPGNDSIRLKHVKVEPQFLPNTNHIDVRTPINIRFECWNFEEEGNLNFSLHLYSMMGELIFNVGTPSVSCKKGVVSGVCQIPAHFLNDGTYYVSVMVVKDKSIVLYNAEEVLTFEVQDYREDTSWYGKWGGMVRPQFHFPISQTEEV